MSKIKSSQITNNNMDESSEVNSKSSFDLSGTDNDEMLRLYLRKAGLNDNLDRYPAVQRRAYIVDIIKSNKVPGYWLPPNMKGFITPPSVLPPPLSQRTSTLTPLRDRKFPSNKSPMGSPRFVRAPDTAPPPSSNSLPKKGNRREISLPLNFQHLSGDLTRDMTRGAFDLNPTGNDNVLRKYMIERGISEDDIAEYSKEFLIRKIVQSNFSWIPPKKKDLNLNIQYAKISSNYEVTPPSSPQPSTSSRFSEFNDYSHIPYAVSAAREPSTTNKEFSNYSLITSRFADPSQFPAPDEIYENANPNISTQRTLPHRIKSKAPLPPTPIKVVVTPQIVKNHMNVVEDNTDEYEIVDVEAQLQRNKNIKKYSTFGKSSTLPPPPPPPPLSTLPRKRIEMLSKTLPTKKFTRLSIDDIQFQPPAIFARNDQKYANTSSNVTNSISKTLAPSPPIRQTQTAAPTPPPPPPPIRQTQTAVPTPPPPPPPIRQTQTAVPTPPPPPPPIRQTQTAVPTPPPPPPLISQTQTAVPTPPPPPPPISQTQTAGPQPPPPPPPPGPMTSTVLPIQTPTYENKSPTSSVHKSGGDPRDDFLKSIREGVSLKKVDLTKNNATLSKTNQKSVKSIPKATDLMSEIKNHNGTLKKTSQKSEKPISKGIDLMSELKMTLRRVRDDKEDSDNELNESNA